MDAEVKIVMFRRILIIDLPKGQSTYLWGARKTGKSTYLEAHYANAWHYDLLKTDLFARLMQKPHEFREEILAKLESLTLDEKSKQCVIVDEIQKIPMLLNEIHYLIEKTKVQFILCGSSARSLRTQHANFLGGRALLNYFYPLVYPEYLKLDLLRIFKQGLLPDNYVSDEKNAKELIKAYVDGYILQEILLETRIRNLHIFMNFLDTLSFSHGNILNFSNIARDCGISSKTIRTYFDILVDMLLGYFIYPFVIKNKRNYLITNAPKFYLFDVGIANYLAKRNITALQGSEAGQAFEHYVFLELHAYLHYYRIDSKCSYWRTKTGLEVDFILQDGSIAIECKIAKTIDKNEYKGLLSFKEDLPEARLIIVSLAPSARIVTITNSNGIETKIEIMPLEFFLQQLWSHKIIKQIN